MRNAKNAEAKENKLDRVPPAPVVCYEDNLNELKILTFSGIVSAYATWCITITLINRTAGTSMIALRYLLFTSSFFLLVTPPAHAYVDPGIIGTLFQVGYALLFGAVFFIFSKPTNYIKSFFKKSSGKDNKSIEIDKVDK